MDKSYQSTATSFKYLYLLGVILSGLLVYLLTSELDYVLIAIAVTVISFIPFAFFFKTFYKIRDGKLLKFSNSGKNVSPSLVINIRDIHKIELIQKGQKTVGIKLFLEKTGRDHLTIRTRDILDFLDRIIKEKPSILVIDKTSFN